MRFESHVKFEWCYWMTELLAREHVSLWVCFASSPSPAWDCSLDSSPSRRRRTFASRTTTLQWWHIWSMRIIPIPGVWVKFKHINISNFHTYHCVSGVRCRSVSVCVVHTTTLRREIQIEQFCIKDLFYVCLYSNDFPTIHANLVSVDSIHQKLGRCALHLQKGLLFNIQDLHYFRNVTKNSSHFWLQLQRAHHVALVPTQTQQTHWAYQEIKTSWKLSMNTCIILRYSV